MIISTLNEKILIASNVNSINLFKIHLNIVHVWRMANTVYGIQILNLIFMLCLVNLLSVQMMLDGGCWMLNVTFALPFKHKRKLNLHNITKFQRWQNVSRINGCMCLYVCANAYMEFRIQCELNFNPIHFLMT